METVNTWKKVSEYIKKSSAVLLKGSGCLQHENGRTKNINRPASEESIQKPTSLLMLCFLQKDVSKKKFTDLVVWSL